MSIGPELEIADTIPDDVWETAWRYSTMALSPHRMRAVTTDSRWSTRYAVARDDRGRTLGMLPLYRTRVAMPPYREYDPVRLAPQLCAGLPTDARHLLFVGGRSDLSAGCVVRASLSPTQQAAVRVRLVRAAVDVARGEGLHAVALYVRDDEIAAFAEVLGDGAIAQIETAAVLPVTGTSPAEYLAGLGSVRRYDARRDLRRIAASGLVTRETAAERAVSAACSLIVAVKARHGIPDHPRLIERRLRGWIASGAGICVAFAVEDDAGGLVAVMFCCDDGRSLEAYELGLAEDSELRHVAYIQAMIYAPLWYAQRRRLTKVELGLGSPEPKHLRGAELRPVWIAVDAHL